MAMAVYGVAMVVAPILGPTLGGYITDNYSWRWIFCINIPVGIVSLILTHFIIEDPPGMAEKIKGTRAQGDCTYKSFATNEIRNQHAKKQAFLTPLDGSSCSP